MEPLSRYLQLTVRQRGGSVFPSVESHPGSPSGKVHGAQGVLVDLHGLGQGLLVTPVTLA